MLDFLKISHTVAGKKGGKTITVRPKFIVNLRTKDLMVQGGDFYAVWDENIGLWSRSEQSVIDQVDKLIDDYILGHPEWKDEGVEIIPLHMEDSDSGSIDKWHKFVQKQMRDIYKPLDEKITFANTKVKQSDFVSKRLPYSLEEGSFEAYDELIGTLYDPDERQKLEWAIGAIVAGDAKHIQKFEVLYGSAGTGKSTILNIIQWLFDGYCSTFSAKDLGSGNNAFALESFKSNPLVSIQHDGDLSRIEDNTKLNSIVSHEIMEINAKYTKLYTSKFNTFLFMGTNKPVKITEAKSGLLRRLIDVKPSGRKVPFKKYQELMSQIKFELGAIAWHCLEVYTGLGESYYDSYIPVDMMSATNDFYDFVDHYYDEFLEKDQITLTEAWQKYKEYCDFANSYKLPLRVMRTELRNYFKTFEERTEIDGIRVRNVYSGFRYDKFERFKLENTEKSEKTEESWLKFDQETSNFDDIFADCLAQGSKEDGSPLSPWYMVKTKLKDIDTRTLHWVKTGDKYPNLVMMDFDKKNADGAKDLKLNIEAARMFPKTYAELSKSGGGIHLYYFYDGDASELARTYGKDIEIKVYLGNSSIRRMLTKCNGYSIATIKPGVLPIREEKRMINWDGLENDKHLRAIIRKHLNKEIVGDTTSSVDLIKKCLDEAYESGIGYDISDMRGEIRDFAAKSTNQSEKCLKTVASMKFKSKEPSKSADIPTGRLVFFDCEVYKNLFVIVWKYAGSDTCVHMVNPKPWEVEDLFKYMLVGFNCRDYDNHILLAASRGYSTYQLYNLSQNIINHGKGKIGEAYNISYTDVYSYTTDKKSLKKWEIALGIHHQEMGIPWDQEVPEDMWEEVVKYCENDVRATEAVFNATQEDFNARKIQVAIAKNLHGDEIGVTVNDTTNTLSKRIIFGLNREPQGEFNYRHLGRPVPYTEYENYRVKFGKKYKFRVFNDEGLPEYRDYIPGEVLPEGYSILPFFKGYEFGFPYGHEFYEKEVTDRVGIGKSYYLGELIGEGGRVYSKDGLWRFVYDGDVNSMHPHSVYEEMLFGPVYTPIFKQLVDARVAVKHGDYETAGKFFGGALKPFLNDENRKGLAQALKIVINSIYGLTSASFINEFRDVRNVDNIVAKRGALFMTLLKREVVRLGYTVCHIKTDSIKIPWADEKIKDFVVRFGHEYGYNFETEDEFVKFCLLNDAAYIGKTKDGEYVTKAAQFNKDTSPYTYKKLFSHEDILFKDMCVTKAVSKGALYLDMNEKLGDPVDDILAKEVKKYERLLKKAEGNKEDPACQVQADIIKKLGEEAPTHHDLKFIGRVGLFCPVKDGEGGGVLYRVDNGKLYAAPGTSGYRWLEAPYIQKYGYENKINEKYFLDQVDQAVADITATCQKNTAFDFEWFISSDGEDPNEVPRELPPGFMNVPEEEDDEVPF